MILLHLPNKLYSEHMGKKRERISGSKVRRVNPAVINDDDDDVLFSDEDISFFQQNASRATFLETLDRDQIHQIHIKQKEPRFQKKTPLTPPEELSDSNDELENYDSHQSIVISDDESMGDDISDSEINGLEDYELQPRSFQNLENVTVQNEKANDENTQARKKQKKSKDLDESKVETQKNTIEEENTAKEKMTSAVNIIKNLKGDFVGKQEMLAKVAQHILADPEQNLREIKVVHELSNDKDSEIARLSILTLFAIFKDIRPSYRIRPPTQKELATKVSKEVGRRRHFEATLLSSYRNYIEKLTTHIKCETSSVLSSTSMACMCELLVTSPRFNLRELLIEQVILGMTSTNIKEVDLCSESIEQLFMEDEYGEPSLEVVKAMAKIIKSRNYAIPELMLRTLTSLRLNYGNLTNSEKEEERGDSLNKKRLRKQEKPFLTRKAKKVEKEKKQVLREMQEAEATYSKEEKERLQTETLKQVFVIYFRILKNAQNSPLLPVVLEGMGRLVHQINVEFFNDLFKVLKDIIATHSEEKCELDRCLLSTRCVLQCVNAIFKLFTGQGQFLLVDLKDIYENFYNAIMESALISYPTSCSTNSRIKAITTTELIKEGMQLGFMNKKKLPFVRIASFAKRLLLVSLNYPNKAVLEVLQILQTLISLHPKLYDFIDIEDQGDSGEAYKPYLVDPDLCHPTSTGFWELGLLSNHYNPTIAKVVTSTFKKRP